MRALIAIFLLASCSAIPKAPPYSYVTAEGTTYTDEAKMAELYGRPAERISRQVRSVLQIEEFEPFELRILEEPFPDSGLGAAATVRWNDANGPRVRYIRLSSQAAIQFHRLIAHELVHWHVELTWGLPLLLEEGLADLVSGQFDPDEAAFLDDSRARALDGIRDDAPILRDGCPLRIDRNSWGELSPEDEHLLYAYGHLLAEGLGIDTLRTMRTMDPDEIERRVEAVLRTVSPAAQSGSPGR